MGGPLAAVRDGDIIHVDADKNLLEVELTDEEIAERLDGFKAKTHTDISRGYLKHYMEHVLQADEGCDFDYMRKDGN